jgi:hypothetical protein
VTFEWSPAELAALAEAFEGRIEGAVPKMA